MSQDCPFKRFVKLADLWITHIAHLRAKNGTAFHTLEPAAKRMNAQSYQLKVIVTSHNSC